MVTREMLEERNIELQVELAEYEKACLQLRGALWENQNVLTAMDEMEEEDGNGVSHNEVVPLPEDYECPEPGVEAPYEEDEAWSEVVAPVEEWVSEVDESEYPEVWVPEVKDGS